MRLRWKVLDLDGTPLAALQDTSIGDVTIPLSDSRVGTVEVSMYDPACVHLTAGDAVIAATYGDQLILNGIILVPSDDFTTGRVTCTLHDSTIRAKHRELRYGHSSVDASIDPLPGVPLDGTGFRMILTDMDDGGGSIPKSGIATGTDTVPAQPASTDPLALYQRMTRGQLAWDALTSHTQSASGFDVDFAPVDAEHPGAVAWVPGIFCEARTVSKQGSDRTQGNMDGNRPITLVYGRELSGLVHAPDAEQMVNYSVQVAPGGQTSSVDTDSRAAAYLHTSWVQYGLWEDWQSSSDQLAPTIRHRVLQDRAIATVTAYGTPPRFITATCNTDEPGGYVFGVDFFVGDLVTVVGKKGFRTVIVDARITQVKLIQRDANGNAQIEVLLVPHHTDSAGVLFDA